MLIKLIYRYPQQELFLLGISQFAPKTRNSPSKKTGSSCQKMRGNLSAFADGGKGRFPPKLSARAYIGEYSGRIMEESLRLLFYNTYLTFV